MIVETFGEAWTRETRRGFFAGEQMATENLLLVAAPVLLTRTLAELSEEA